MAGADEREARRALARLRRSVEKARRELAAAAAALRGAEGGGFPSGDFEAAGGHLEAVEQFIEEQSDRLREKLLRAGGLDPGRLSGDAADP